MTELKTLKDFEMYWRFSEKDFLRKGMWTTFLSKVEKDPQKHEQMISANDLKQEAIKWIKSYPKAYYQENNLVTNWIKLFFNITDEDLK